MRNWKNILLWAFGVVVILALLWGPVKKFFSYARTTETEESDRDTTISMKAFNYYYVTAALYYDLNDSIVNLSEKMADLKAENKLLKTHRDIAEVEKENAALKRQVSTYKKWEKSVAESTSKIIADLEAKFTASQKNLTYAVDTAVATNSKSNPVNIPAGTKYVGDVIGDAGVSFDENSKLFYYVKKDLEQGISNRNQSFSNLNGPDGPAGEVVGDYIYYRTPVVIDVNMLNNEYPWTAYLGSHVQYNYGMWLFHELLKKRPEFKDDTNLQANGSGGYHYLSQFNYHAK